MKSSKFNESIFTSREISGIGTRRTMGLLRGRTAKILNFISKSITYSSTRSFGCFFLSFGFLSLLLNLGEYYFVENPNVSFSSLIISIVFVGISLPLLVFDLPMCIALQDFPVTNKLLFGFFSIKPAQRSEEHVSIPPIIALFIGAIPAVIAFFVPIELVALGFLVLTVVATSFVSPEFPMMLTVILLPYVSLIPHPVFVLSALSVLTFVSYSLKVLLGKRVFNFGIYDVLILLVGLFVFVGGALGGSADTLKNSVVFIALMLAYFPVSNIIVNRRLANAAINAIIVSAIPIIAIAVVEFIVELPSTPYSPPTHSTPGISAFFATPSALLAYMLVSAMLTMVVATRKKKIYKKIFYGAVCLLEVGVLIISMRPEAWIAMLMAILAYPIIKSRRIPLVFLLAFILLPHVVVALPNEFFDAIYETFGKNISFADKLACFKYGAEVFSENIWFGIGRGNTKFAVIMNTVLGIGVEFGIFTLVLFCVMTVTRLHHLSYYRIYVRSSIVRSTGEMTTLALVALLAYGSLEYIFADVSVIYLFWLVFGISSAVLRTAKREHDDRQGYYGDSSSSDFSALDISVNSAN